jgi:hypothetical protein
MSDHYDLFFTFDLKPDLPIPVVNALDYVTGKNPALENLPQDSKFSVGTWKDLLVVHPHYENMLHFAGHAISDLSTAYRHELPESKGGGKVYRQTITFRYDILDDGIHEYLMFLDWIAPYIETEGFIGYFLTNGDRNNVKIIVYNNGKLNFLKITPSNQADS